MTSTPESVMIYAAGFGTRMGALTRNRPKPLIEVNGTPLIDHALKEARGVEPKTIVVNLHYRADMLAEHLSAPDLTLAIESPDILETGGGLLAALPLLGPKAQEGGPVFTLNSDCVWRGPNPLACLRDAWQPESTDALLLCVAPDRAVGHAGKGDFIAGKCGLASRGPGLIYTGAQIIRTEGLNDIGTRVFSLNRLWDRLIEKRRLRILPYPGKWCDVGTPQGIALAEALERSAGV